MRSMSRTIWSISLALAAAVQTAPAFDVTLEPMPGPGVPITGAERQADEIELALDDGHAEEVFGLSQGGAAIQFMWFNHFVVEEAIDIDDVRVLFPSGANIAVGAPVDIAVFRDTDGDPADGTALVRVVHGSIQATDGTTLSSFPLEPPVSIAAGRHLHVGVIPRFIVSGVTGMTLPATLDTTIPRGESWFAVWSGDPPASPSLPPDQVLLQVDAFEPGNWTIRLAGTRQVLPEGIPGPGVPGALVLVLALAVTGCLALRRFGSH